MKEKVNKDSPWLKLNIKVDLESCLNRNILFEKFSKKIQMTDVFISKIHNCELFKHDSYQDSIFYVKNAGTKNSEIIMEKDEKNGNYVAQTPR